MQRLDSNSWSEQLVVNKMRTKEDWQTRLGSDLFVSLKQIGALEIVADSDLNDFEGIFNLSGSLLRARLEVEAGVITAIPVEGGDAVNISKGELVYKAKPAALVEIILRGNEFNILDVDANLNPLIRFAERKIEDKKFLMVICLDSNWSEVIANQSLIRTTSLGYVNTVIVSPSGNLNLPHLSKSKIPFGQEPIPTAETQYKISNEHYTALRFGLSVTSVVNLYSDKKIIIEMTSNKVFIFGYEIRLTADSYPHRYLVGLCRTVGSEQPNDYFAKNHLMYHDHDIDGTVRRARAQAKQALKKAILVDAQFLMAEALCMPSSAPDRVVTSGFLLQDILFLER